MGKWADRNEFHNLSANSESAVALLAVLRREGLCISRVGCDVLVKPKALMNEQRRFLIRNLKPAILAVLVIEQAKDERQKQ